MDYKKSMPLVTAIFFIFSSCSNQSTSNVELEKLENMVDIDSFKNKNSYDRFYYIENQIAIGVYIKSGNDIGLIHIVNSENLPIVMDGGCSVINVKFDLKNIKVISAFCNGDA